MEQIHGILVDLSYFYSGKIGRSYFFTLGIRQWDSVEEELAGSWHKEGISGRDPWNHTGAQWDRVSHTWIHMVWPERA